MLKLKEKGGVERLLIFKKFMNIQKNFPLASFTTFNIGGPASFFCEVSDESELIEALDYVEKNNLKVFVLGGGSNVLFNDDGFDGMVIKLKDTNFLKIEKVGSDILVNCWAGERLGNIVNFCAKNSLTGLEWAVGIPGSLSGAIRGNAGAYGYDMKSVVEKVKAFGYFCKDNSSVNESENDRCNLEHLKNKNEKKFILFSNKECDFSYRFSIFKKYKNLVIVSAFLKLKKGDRNQIKNQMEEIIKKRREKLPKEKSAGSFFENPKVEKKEIILRFEKDSGKKCHNQRIPAGWLIEEVGLRGKKIGRAKISEEHANFLVNSGGATAKDVIMLSSFVKMKVRNEFGIQLKEEVQYVGF
jgi:UDP-N-acetylmuramate dehydrogenase